MKLRLYIVIIILLIFCILFLNKNLKENYDSVEEGPWGNIGTGKPWYDYPYILNNIEY